jgi:GxxExxY protein
MNTDKMPDLQSGRGEAYPLKTETREIIGCAFEILNELGHGLNEKCYENSMVVEFKRHAIAFEQQRRFEVLYKHEHVGEFIPDPIAFQKVVVDTKVIDQITDYERGQMLNYLRVTRLPVGLILNFKHPRLQWERVVLTAADRIQPQMSEDNSLDDGQKDLTADERP